MERAETACSYCGVSYLILHEFQRLQDQLKRVEEELAAGRGIAARDRAASGQLREIRTALQLQQERSLCSRQRALLREVLCVLQSCGSGLCGVKEQIILFSKHWNSSRAQLLQHCSTASRERDMLQQEVARTEAELARLQGAVREMGAELDACRVRAQTLEDQVLDQEALQNQIQQAQVHIQGLKQEVETLKKELHKSYRERKHLEDLLELSQHLREKEESWLSCQCQCDYLQQQLLAWQRKGDEMTQELERAKAEREELKATLKVTHTHTTALLKEREALKSTQRDEVQELENAFLKRLELVEGQRSKLQGELSVLELQLHEREEEVLRARMEASELLQERRTRDEEHQQRALELQQALRNLQQLREEHAALQEELQGELSVLELQLHEREEEVLRARVEASELLQERRTRDEEHQQRALELQQALRNLQQLREEHAALQEENTLLQETVRRECEERAELTATLSDAREQLMKLRKVETGLPDPRGTTGPSLPDPTPGHGRLPGRDTPARGRSSASWHGVSRTAPALPKLNKQRAMPVSQARPRVAMAMDKRDMS